MNHPSSVTYFAISIWIDSIDTELIANLYIFTQLNYTGPYVFLMIVWSYRNKTCFLLIIIVKHQLMFNKQMRSGRGRGWCKGGQDRGVLVGRIQTKWLVLLRFRLVWPTETPAGIIVSGQGWYYRTTVSLTPPKSPSNYLDFFANTHIKTFILPASSTKHHTLSVGICISGKNLPSSM